MKSASQISGKSRRRDLSGAAASAGAGSIDPHYRCPIERLIVRRWREPAAIAAEIDRIRPLRLYALRRLVFGRKNHPRASEAPGTLPTGMP